MFASSYRRHGAGSGFDLFKARSPSEPSRIPFMDLLDDAFAWNLCIICSVAIWSKFARRLAAPWQPWAFTHRRQSHNSRGLAQANIHPTS